MGDHEAQEKQHYDRVNIYSLNSRRLMKGIEFAQRKEITGSVMSNDRTHIVK